MLQTAYTFEELKFSSQLIRDFINQDAKVQPLVQSFFKLEDIPKIAADKNFDDDIRKDLVAELQVQNQSVELSELSSTNINALKDSNTYTVTTGHQLNLLSGPLFSIYKIAQCIALADTLNIKYADKKFVPVFWMATEDHDFEEINHIHLFGKKIAWQKEDQKDVIVGRINTNNIGEFLSEIEEKFQDPDALKVVQEITHHYRNSENLAEAARNLINDLFGVYGIVILDGDAKSLKKHFGPIMKKEIEEQIGYEKVMQTNEYLTKNNYHEQVFVRHSNLFYIDETGLRKRIKIEDNHYFIEEEELTKEALLQLIDEQAERFSPNALYRPLYQETILPNLVYIGGGGEIAYWLQIKSLFDAHQLDFPILKVRDSILLYNQEQANLMKEFDLELMDLKLGVDQIVKAIALDNTEDEIELKDAEASLLKTKEMVLEKAETVNPGLKVMVEAEFTKMLNAIEKIEQKLIKAEKGKHEKVQKKLQRLRTQFFPENGFQERYDNFLPFYLKHPDFINKIVSNLKIENQTLVRTIEI